MDSRSWRYGLVSASLAVVVVLLAGSVALRVGAAEGAYRQVVLFSEALGHVLDKYVDPLEPEPLLRGAYEAMLTSLDPESAYLTPEEIDRWDEAVAAGAADPGLNLLKVPGSLTVVAVAAGSPAAEAGLEPGDQVRAIESRRAGEFSLLQAHVWLRGAPGSRVAVDVLHPHAGFKREHLELERRLRDDPPFTLDVVEGIAVLRLHDLGRLGAVAERLREELRSVYPSRAGRVLLDLRGETRAEVAETAALLGLFVEGPVLVLKDRSGRKVRTLAVEAAPWQWPGPVGLLVSHACAGGAEAVAAVLREARGATVYGETTYGMGAEVERVSLEDGAALLLATARWETGSGPWHGEGIEPDVVVERGTGEGADDAQLQRALKLFAERAEAEQDAA